MSSSSKEKVKWHLAVLLSGNGSNLQALMDRCADGTINGQIDVVVSNNKYAYGLTRARDAGIETMVFEPPKYNTRTIMCAKMAKFLKEKNIDLVCLAGYLLKLEPCMVRAFSNRIINIHPSLLPLHGGKGMYGLNVHKSVIESGESQSGASVHLVDEIFDNGDVLQQGKVPVKKGDTPEELAKRILTKEHSLYVSVVKQICDGKIKLERKGP